MQLPPAVFSKHANERTVERFKISPKNLSALMKAGFGKKIGQSRHSNLIHRLLWSPEDECLLVVIQEVISGTVLTVLTTDMYKRDYADNLSESRIIYVVNQMVHAGHVPAEMWNPGCKKCHVTVHAHLSVTPGMISLGRWPRQVNSVNLSRLGIELEFWAWIAQRLVEKQHSVDSLLCVDARFFGGQNWRVEYLAFDGA